MHVIQAFFPDDRATQLQIEGRTAREGKSGSSSFVLAESEVKDLGLNPADLRNIGAERIYPMLCNHREQKKASTSKKLEGIVDDANALDQQSHVYFDCLLQGNHLLAREKLMQLRKQLGQQEGPGVIGGYHLICCYDDSDSMNGTPWRGLVDAHLVLMQKVVGITPAKASLIQFSESAQMMLKMVNVQEAYKHRLLFRGGRRTNFNPPLQAAMDLMRLGQRQFPNLMPLLLFMSDGSNNDGDCSEKIAHMNREFPTMLFHAVIFRKPDSTRLREMAAAATNGHFHVSIDGMKLVETFSSIASSLEYTGRG